MEENEKKETQVEIGSLYELNKSLVQKEKSIFSKKIIKEKKKIILDFLKETENNYYMLLSNERKDYTVFNILNKDNEDEMKEVADILVDECLFNRGILKSIHKTNDNGAIEIWISIDEESYIYYFFPYDSAIIIVGGE